MKTALAIEGVGLVSSVGNSAPSTCAAIRAHVTNPTQTRFRDAHGTWIMAHQVDLGIRGLKKLARMAAMAILESLQGTAASPPLPLLLCVAEPTRPGRIDGLEGELLSEIESDTGMRFHRHHSLVISAGRPGALLALQHAGKLLRDGEASRVIVAATDSLLQRDTLQALSSEGRLLTEDNSNGFMPGEGAGALLLAQPGGSRSMASFAGMGCAQESCTIRAEEPLRAEGLTDAIRQALASAATRIEDIDVRISDVSGEQYGFKEAALAIGRLLRVRRENQDLWNPADTVGETGSAIGPLMVAVGAAALRKDHGSVRPILVHAGSDDGVRAASVLVPSAPAGARS